MRGLKKTPKKIIDVCCGDGKLVRELSSAYPGSRVYGLDIGGRPLIEGICAGNFKKAVPIHGNAYDLLKENPDFSLMHIDWKYRKRNVGWDKIEYGELKEKITDFDLVTTVDPSYKLSEEDINESIAGKESKKSHVPISVISEPAKKEGHIYYEKEIAFRGSGLWGGLSPEDLTLEHIESFLDEMKKEGKDFGLEPIDHRITGNDWYTDIGVLYRKK